MTELMTWRQRKSTALLCVCGHVCGYQFTHLSWYECTHNQYISVCVFLFDLSSVLMSPQASVNDPLYPQRSTKRFPRRPANFQPGPDPHLDQLESICYCKYKFGNL